MSNRWRTPPQIAEQLAIDPEKVVGWIKSGALTAINVGEGSVRPRYRISPEALEQFLRQRQTSAPVPPVRRRRKLTTGKEYF